MLLRAIFKNFLSFDSETEFNMFPNHRKRTLMNHVYAINDSVSVLKMAALYGGNGAGKSNFTKGINFVARLVKDPSFLKEEKIDRYFFALKKDAGKEPMELTIEFTNSDNQGFIYTISISSEGITFEGLYSSGLGVTKTSPIFVRETGTLTYPKINSEGVQLIVGSWLKKNAFVSFFHINSDMDVINIEHFSTAKDWLNSYLSVLDLNSINPHLIGLYRKNDELRKFTSDMFHNIGLGIDSVKVDTSNFDEWVMRDDIEEVPTDKIDKLNDENRGISQLVNFRNVADLYIEDGIKKISQLMFDQYGKNGFTKEMDIMSQSDGTVRLLTLAPALYWAIVHGHTVVIDEIDNKIHPHLLRELVRYFSQKETNGQLIFTTHQTCLLSQQIIRTDEVWFAEKVDGATQMYSLNDFKEHNTINIENGYLEGRYGAIPFIGMLDM